MDRDDEWLERYAHRPDSEIAAVWIDYQSRPHSPKQDALEDPSWWAVDAMMGLSRDNPLRALEICFQIARLSARPEVLEMLGAGPLEDLLSEDPTLFDALVFEVTSNPRLAEALRSVWKSTIPDDVWLALQRLIGNA